MGQFRFTWSSGERVIGGLTSYRERFLKHVGRGSTGLVLRKFENNFGLR
jgi:hypothetical protein